MNIICCVFYLLLCFSLFVFLFRPPNKQCVATSYGCGPVSGLRAPARRAGVPAGRGRPPGRAPARPASLTVLYASGHGRWLPWGSHPRLRPVPAYSLPRAGSAAARCARPPRRCTGESSSGRFPYHYLVSTSLRSPGRPSRPAPPRGAWAARPPRSPSVMGGVCRA